MSNAAARSLLVLPLIVVGACATDQGDPPPPDPGADPAPGPPAGEAAVTDLSPRSGAPGTEVRVEGVGFAPGSTVRVGFGPPQSEYEVVTTVEADPGGDVEAVVPVPSWASAGRSYLFVLAAPDNDPRAISEPFQVTSGDGSVSVEGRITDEGVECLAMRARDGTLYTLAGGDTGDLQPGDQVAVRGTVAEVSICQQGITLQVESVERR